MESPMPYFPVGTFVSFPHKSHTVGVVYRLVGNLFVKVLTLGGTVAVPVMECVQLDPPLDPNVRLSVSDLVFVRRGFLKGMSGKVLGTVNGQVFIRPTRQSNPSHPMCVGSRLSIVFIAEAKNLWMLKDERVRVSVTNNPRVKKMSTILEREEYDTEDDTDDDEEGSLSSGIWL